MVGAISAFLRMSVNVIMSFDIHMLLRMDNGISRLREFVNYLIIKSMFHSILHVSHVRSRCFLSAVSEEWKGIEMSYFPRWLRRGNNCIKNVILIK